MNKKDITGQKFTRLLVMQSNFDKVKKKTICACICDCGNKINTFRENLVTEHTRSCGCLLLEFSSKNFITHGMRYTRLYNIWCLMKSRCTNPNNPRYKDYGGRSIAIYEPWLFFENFYKDNGQAYEIHVKQFGEKNTTLNRINNNGNYEPGNVEWATRSEQARNTRISSKTENFDLHTYLRQKITQFLNEKIQKNRNTPLFEYRFGISLEGFKKHIASKFKDGMTWDNHGCRIGQWEFDHIKGCNNFDLSKEEDVLKCFHYTNFQPLWHEDHLKKSELTLVQI